MASVRLSDYATKSGSFESKPGGYLATYEKYFSSLKDGEIKLLELGVATGLSMQMWRDYFPRGTIVGVDLYPGEVNDPRVHIYRGPQNDTAFLSRIANERAPDGFDIIIDDCAHIGELAKTSFWHLFLNHLKPGGYYVIEDWGTGYWGNHHLYPDGEFFKPSRDNGAMHWLANKVLNTGPLYRPKLGLLGRLLRRYQYTRRFPSHDYGMVGFVKQLVDECGRAEITNPKWADSSSHGSTGVAESTRFSEMLITPGLVLITKAVMY
jgi:hypothetical protein